MARGELDELLALFFAAEFCEESQKAEKEQVRDAALGRIAEAKGLSVQTLRLAILSAAYPDYKRERLKNELPTIPPHLRRF